MSKSNLRLPAGVETAVRRPIQSFFKTKNGAVTTEFVVVSATVATLALSASILALAASFSIYVGAQGSGSRALANIELPENAIGTCGTVDGPGSTGALDGPTEAGKSDGSGGKAAPRKLGITDRVVLSAN